MRRREKIVTIVVGICITTVIGANIAVFTIVDKKRKAQINAELGVNQVNYYSTNEKIFVEVYSNKKGDSLFMVKQWDWDQEGGGKYWVKLGEFKKRNQADSVKEALRTLETKKKENELQLVERYSY
ncbi:MAG: hypothetical protein IM631_12655 [Cytophagales bacterium]|nr:hypothetical protein [Cytophagales bacterium]MCA6382366.1 hypothetical protein [Cytophagales bacterium]